MWLEITLLVIFSSCRANWWSITFTELAAPVCATATNICWILLMNSRESISLQFLPLDRAFIILTGIGRETPLAIPFAAPPFLASLRVGIVPAAIVATYAFVEIPAAETRTRSCSWLSSWCCTCSYKWVFCTNISLSRVMAWCRQVMTPQSLKSKGQKSTVPYFKVRRVPIIVISN